MWNMVMLLYLAFLHRQSQTIQGIKNVKDICLTWLTVVSDLEDIVFDCLRNYHHQTIWHSLIVCVDWIAKKLLK